MPRHSKLEERMLYGSDLAERYLDWRPWAATVGNRVRRLRMQREMTLGELRTGMALPRGHGYSIPHLSHLERGRASAPFYAYLAIADALEIHPGLLMGPDDVDKPVTDAERVLLRALRRLAIEPDAALARIADLPDP